eukprot:5464029-Alexandrium_andersonii.AAC.1
MESEEAAPVSMRPCSCCLRPRGALNGRGRCRFCAVLRRLQRLQAEYRVHDSVWLGLVVALE